MFLRNVGIYLWVFLASETRLPVLLLSTVPYEVTFYFSHHVLRLRFARCALLGRMLT
jgi:hypothetical protein